MKRFKSPPGFFQNKPSSPPLPLPFKRKRQLEEIAAASAPVDSETKKFKAPTTAAAHSGSAPKKFKAPPQDWIPQVRRQTRRRRKKKQKEDSVFQLCSTSGEELNAEDFALPAEYHKAGRKDPKLIIDRHQPRSLDDLVGQQEAVAQIREWFRRFQSKRPAELPRGLLLVGPTGVGKSSAARIVMQQEMGYLIHEYSGDDHVETNKKEQYGILSEKGIEEVIYKMLCRNQAFGKFGLILDGIGGASLKDDAQKSLVDVITGQKYARQFQKKNANRIWQAPVIITCDAVDLAGLTKLARVCEVVEFSTPTLPEVAAFFQNICQLEQLDIPPEVQEKVVKGCGGDIRRLLNTLHFLTLEEVASANVTDMLDVNTIFYSNHSMFEVAKVFLERQKSERLHELTSLMELHPVSLAMLLQENSLRIYQRGEGLKKKQLEFGPNGVVSIQWRGQTGQEELDNLERMAATAEFVSSIDEMDAMIYAKHHWDMEEVYTTLSCWGVAKTMESALGDESANDSSGDFEKSAYFSWHQKEKYRRKLMAHFPNIPAARGVDFIETASVISSMVSRHVTTKQCDEELLAYCKHHRVSYKDLQDLWKCAHMSGSMPNLRGNQSLKKLLS